eukprot:3458466-Prymnesium_polylepis.1
MARVLVCVQHRERAWRLRRVACPSEATRGRHDLHDLPRSCRPRDVEAEQRRALEDQPLLAGHGAGADHVAHEPRQQLTLPLLPLRAALPARVERMAEQLDAPLSAARIRGAASRRRFWQEVFGLIEVQLFERIHAQRCLHELAKRKELLVECEQLVRRPQLAF